MSERTPTASYSTGPEEQPSGDVPDSLEGQGFDDEIAHEQARLNPDAAEPSEPTPERTADTHEEAGAREALRENSELEGESTEQASWRVRALNGKDRIQSTVTLQTARQLRLEGRAARLERKLAGAKPHSRRAMRLQTALNLANYRIDKINSARDKTFGRIHERSRGYSGEVEKFAAIERRRHEQIVKVKVAIEKKRRRKIEEAHKREARQADPSLRQRMRQELYNDQHRRKRLAKEIASWPHIDTFKEKLAAEVEARHKHRIKNKGL